MKKKKENTMKIDKEKKKKNYKRKKWIYMIQKKIIQRKLKHQHIIIENFAENIIKFIDETKGADHDIVILFQNFPCYCTPLPKKTKMALEEEGRRHI